MPRRAAAVPVCPKGDRMRQNVKSILIRLTAEELERILTKED